MLTVSTSVIGTSLMTPNDHTIDVEIEPHQPIEQVHQPAHQPIEQVHQPAHQPIEQVHQPAHQPIEQVHQPAIDQPAPQPIEQQPIAPIHQLGQPPTNLHKEQNIIPKENSHINRSDLLHREEDEDVEVIHKKLAEKLPQIQEHISNLERENDGGQKPVVEMDNLRGVEIEQDAPDNEREAEEERGEEKRTKRDDLPVEGVGDIGGGGTSERGRGGIDDGERDRGERRSIDDGGAHERDRGERRGIDGGAHERGRGERKGIDGANERDRGEIGGDRDREMGANEKGTGEMGGGGGAKEKMGGTGDNSYEEIHHNQRDRRHVETGSERKRDGGNSNSKSQLTNKIFSLEKDSSSIASEKGKEEVKTSPLAEGEQNRTILTITDKERSIPPALPPIKEVQREEVVNHNKPMRGRDLKHLTGDQHL